MSRLPLLVATAALWIATAPVAAGATLPVSVSLDLAFGSLPTASFAVGVSGTRRFHVMSLVAGAVFGNPYQLGMLTLMGALNTTPHTLIATGVDNRTVGGVGTLVLVSPTTVALGPLGTLARSRP